MKKLETILVGTDFTPLADVALAAALDLARATGAKRLHVVHVINTATAATIFPYSVPEAQLMQALERSVQEAQARLDGLDFVDAGYTITRKAILGPPGRELALEAERVGADLVVAASHGYGAVRRTLIGSVTSSLIRTAHCPVLVVGEERPCRMPFKNVLASVDLSGVSRDILGYAAGLADEEAELHVLSLFEHPLVTYDGSDVLPRYVSEEEIARLAGEHAKAVQALVDQVQHPPTLKVDIQAMSKAPASQVILETEEILQPNLIVLGTSGHNAWHRMILGSTATRVVAEARCPVLVVPHDVRHGD
ncbi:MAG: universal stress protein [Myxococcales bacterium]|nr:universal stress protein [Myxococcales bacterium]